MNDPDGDVDKIVLHGTDNADIMGNLYASEKLEDYDSQDLECVMRGHKGADDLYGSPSQSNDYSESLRGDAGADDIYGLEGDDELRAGAHDDNLYGGSGWDVLVAGKGFDELHGQDGWDILCTEDPAHLLVGSDEWSTSDLNVLYISSVGEGTPVNYQTTTNSDYNTCGHPDVGTSWGDCNDYDLTAAPVPCAAAGIDD